MVSSIKIMKYFGALSSVVEVTFAGSLGQLVSFFMGLAADIIVCTIIALGGQFNIGLLNCLKEKGILLDSSIEK